MIRTLLFALAALSLQASAAVVGFNPASTTVNVGDTFVVGVDGSGFATELDGGGLNLSFDPAVLSVLDVIIDSTATGWNFFVDKGSIDNVAGTVSGTQFNQFGSPKVGSFPILQYQFQAKAEGSSALQLTQFADNPFASGGELVVPMNFDSGSVHVVPEPQTYAMLLAGLGLLAFLRMQKS
jgi:hypothetical protein